MGSELSKAGPDASQQANCGMEWLCQPATVESSAAGALGGSVSEDFAESQLNIHMKIKRRQQNVFAESVEVGQVAEKTITAAMRKSDQQKQIIRSALKKNFVFATLSVEEMEKFIEYMEKEEVAAAALVHAKREVGAAKAATQPAKKVQRTTK